MNDGLLKPFADTKKHYEILDGLRGVAAIIVIMFHICEAHAGGDNAKILVNHGYLAVDFFFVLSGFVVGYAYDDRWGKGEKPMTLGKFFKRRIVRLHPMLVMGMTIGAATFYLQDSSWCPGIHTTTVGTLLIVFVMSLFMIPVTPENDIRGWGDMYSLDGPAWTLFFEYIGNILYALIIRKLSNTVLMILLAIMASFTIHYGLTTPFDAFVGGWSFSWEQMGVGFIRFGYPFTAGLLLSRFIKPGNYSHSFLLCSIILAAVMFFPHLDKVGGFSMSGLFDAMCIIFVFPAVVFLGASGEVKGKKASQVCKFLGEVTFPIYITHYSLIYIYSGWVVDNKISFVDSLPMALLTLLGSIALGYACLRLYDIPLRNWLKKKWLQ